MITQVAQQGVQKRRTAVAVERNASEFPHVAAQHRVERTGILLRHDVGVQRPIGRIEPLANVEPAPRKIFIARSITQQAAQVGQEDQEAAQELSQVQ